MSVLFFLCSVLTEREELVYEIPFQILIVSLEGQWFCKFTIFFIKTNKDFINLKFTRQKTFIR